MIPVVRLKPLLHLLPALLAWPVLAAGPTYTISADLNGMAVTHQASTSEMQARVFLTNHDRDAALCDARLKTNRNEVLHKKEIAIRPGETTEFTFRYGKVVESIHIDLVCEAHPHPEQLPPLENAPGAGVQKPDEKAKPKVIVEDLGGY